MMTAASILWNSNVNVRLGRLQYGPPGVSRGIQTGFWLFWEQGIKSVKNWWHSCFKKSPFLRNWVVFFCMERHQENKWALWEAYFRIFVSLFVASLPAATTFLPYGTPTSKLVHVNKPATVLLRNAALFGLHHLNCRATCLRCVFHKHARTRWWCAASCWTGAFVALRGLQIKGRFLPNKFYSRRTLAVNTCIRFMLTFQMA